MGLPASPVLVTRKYRGSLVKAHKACEVAPRSSRKGAPQRDDGLAVGKGGLVRPCLSRPGNFNFAKKRPDDT